MAFAEQEAAARSKGRPAVRHRAVAAGRHVAVIGGGLGGLATALRLAHLGWRVTVYERFQRVGGKMNRLEADGFRFDTGPSLITMPWVFEELFASVDEVLAHHLAFVPVEPLCHYTFADGTTLTMSRRLSESLPAIRRLEGRHAQGFLQFVSMGARVLDLSLKTFFDRSPWERPRLGDVSALLPPPPPALLRPYASVVADLCRSPHVRQLLNRYATYVGSDPSRLPAMYSVIPAMEMLYGGVHIVGGLYRLIEVLEDLCRHRGVEIRTNCHVHRILVSGKRVHAVEVGDGEMVPCDVVVFNGDTARLSGLLGERGRNTPATDRSLSGLVFLYSIRRRLEGHPHHHVFFSADYDAEFRELFIERRFPTDPTVYVCIPTRTDTSMAPPGCEAVFVMANAPANDGDDWDVSMQEEAKDRVLARLRGSGLAEILRNGRLEAVLTPRVMGDTFDMPGGAIYGAAAHGIRSAFLRPPNRHPRIRGLYCVGGSTHPGGGTPTVLLSARIVTRLINAHEQR